MTVTRIARARGAKTTRGTVLFADLRGYTALAERLPPARIVPLLEEFFHVLAGATDRYGGRIYHMAGVGGVDPDEGDGAVAGLAAGHAMLQGFAPLAERWKTDLSCEAGVGVG